MEHTTLIRSVIIAVLILMVGKSLVWLIHPEVDAGVARYALNVANVLICGFTAYVTWRPSAGAQRVLSAFRRR